VYIPSNPSNPAPKKDNVTTTYKKEKSEQTQIRKHA